MARALLLGFAIGFPIAASPGPIFVLILRRTLARGWRSGLVSGLGVATGDAAYAALAAFGVAAVTNVLLAERRWISLVGGIGLTAIGLRTLLSTEAPTPTLPRRRGREIPTPSLTLPARGRETLGTPSPTLPTRGREYASTLALTLSNPPTILSFAAVFAGLGAHVSSGWPPALALVVGVTIGSALWWVVLTAIVAAVRERLTPEITRGVALVSGVVLIVAGILISLQSL
jgi:threonine/homoserine/homoserine lactone efflux protein